MNEAKSEASIRLSKIDNDIRESKKELEALKADFAELKNLLLSR